MGSDHYQGSAGWVVSMVIGASISAAITVVIIVFALYHHLKKSDETRSKMNTTLVGFIFALWTFNLLSCLTWSLLRTNFYSQSLLLPSKYCPIVYSLNYVFYLCGKYCLHIFLIYRLHACFSETLFQVNRRFLSMFASVTTVNYLAGLFLFIRASWGHVYVGPTSVDSLSICGSHVQHGVIFHVLFGIQDFVISLVTLALFLQRMRQAMIQTRDPATFYIVKKLFLLGGIMAIYALILYVVLVPLNPEYVLLLPSDVLLTSICIFLQCSFAQRLYGIACYPCDACVHYVATCQAISACSPFKGVPIERRHNTLSLHNISSGSYQKSSRAQNAFRLKSPHSPISPVRTPRHIVVPSCAVLKPAASIDFSIPIHDIAVRSNPTSPTKTRNCVGHVARSSTLPTLGPHMSSHSVRSDISAENHVTETTTPFLRKEGDSHVYDYHLSEASLAASQVPSLVLEHIILAPKLSLRTTNSSEIMCKTRRPSF